MRVGPASKRNPLLSTTNLYIEGVPKEWTDADLRKHFGEFGEIAAARILVDKGSHTSREVGFVHFTNHENALSAMETWQDNKAYKTAERPFKIKFANKGRKKDEDDNDSMNNNKPKKKGNGGPKSMSNKGDMSISSYTSPVGPSQYPQSEMNTPRFDEPCRYFQRGNCKRGKNCFYRHGNVEQIISSHNRHSHHTHSVHPPPPPHHLSIAHHHPTHPQHMASTYDPYTAAAVSASMAAAASAASMAAYPHVAAATDPSLSAYYQQYYGAYGAYGQQPPTTDPATAAYYQSAYANAAYPHYPHYGATGVAATAAHTQPTIATANVNVATEEKAPSTATTETANSTTVAAPTSATAANGAVAGYGATRAGVTAATDARWDPYKAQAQAQAAAYPYTYAAPTQ
eukprot:CAMPEP_0201569486 /NCGR_PEP_ID=MMETSP0190_2-20130828/11177_1 /ASSEMBLY_ACC=CAM_ASM_000263 /TAXON_ID=37353 /ORGANISM="Rosalina sp." /LENGTH=399 /DNA_ID=CAMNT_0047991839 /DNA_START=183 /DNA_END=1382 /DNA_ORIENTATION=-